MALFAVYVGIGKREMHFWSQGMVVPCLIWYVIGSSGKVDPKLCVLIG